MTIPSAFHGTMRLPVIAAPMFLVSGTALVAETSLTLIGTKGTLLVEGRFAEAEVFVRALASLQPDLAIYTANAHNDVSFGALRLINPALRPEGALSRIKPLDTDLSGYRNQWITLVEGNA